MSILLETTDFLSVNDVFEIHSDMCDKSDINRGVMDQGRLREAALAAFDAAQTRAVPVNALYALAAIYAESIMMLRPFAEGNERAAWLVVQEFLFLNSINFHPRPDDVAYLMDSEYSRDQLEQFIEENSTDNP